MFPRTVEVDPDAVLLCYIVIDHLSDLEEKLRYYFPSLNVSDKD